MNQKWFVRNIKKLKNKLLPDEYLVLASDLGLIQSLLMSEYRAGEYLENS